MEKSEWKFQAKKTASCILKMVKIVNFMLFLFDHNRKKEGKQPEKTHWCGRIIVIFGNVFNRK